MSGKGKTKTGGRTAGTPKTKAVKKSVSSESKDIRQAAIGEKQRPFIYPKIVDNKKTGLAEINLDISSTTLKLGTYSNDLWNNTINQICNICTMEKASEDGDRSFRSANAALAAVVEIDPKDSIELMLAAQMTAVHNMAMEMSNRAMKSGQPVDAVDRNVNRVTKLMRTFTTQIEALNRYRTKGQQKITVQHVNVEKGGQAIVGDVNQGGGND
jgi:hypothetical protein